MDIRIRLLSEYLLLRDVPSKIFREQIIRISPHFHPQHLVCQILKINVRIPATITSSPRAPTSLLNDGLILLLKKGDATHPHIINIPRLHPTLADKLSYCV